LSEWDHLWYCRFVLQQVRCIPLLCLSKCLWTASSRESELSPILPTSNTFRTCRLTLSAQYAPAPVFTIAEHQQTEQLTDCLLWSVCGCTRRCCSSNETQHNTGSKYGVVRLSWLRCGGDCSETVSLSPCSRTLPPAFDLQGCVSLHTSLHGRFPTALFFCRPNQVYDLQRGAPRH
jgi:hypothetical protein